MISTPSCIHIWKLEGINFESATYDTNNILHLDVQKKQLGTMLDEDPGLMEKREAIARRLELYKSARDEIDSVAWK